MTASWRAALRIARRDSLRARGRSTLIVAMVALPVLALTALVTLLEIYELGPGERAARHIGAADAAYSSSGTGGPIVQSPMSLDGYTTPAPTGHGTSVERPVDPRSVIPAGSRVIPSRQLAARVRAHGELYSVGFEEVDYADPIARGMYRQRAGRAPRSRDEIAVTTRLREKLELSLGDTVRVTSSAAGGDDRTLTLTVVGVVVDPKGLANLGVVALPGTLYEKMPAQHDPTGATTWLADTPTPVSWADVRAANQAGVLAVSRSVLLDPPPPAAVPVPARGSMVVPPMAAAATAVVGAMGILEVVLLAGAAFAVGTRRQSRQLALVVAGGGGDRRHIRRIVLAGGAVLGVAGAGAGLVLGAAGAAVAAQVATWLSFGSLPGRFGVPPLQAAGIGALGAVTGVLAALVPARGAARQDVVAALTGRRGVVRTKRRYPVIGLALCLLGAALAGAGAAASASGNQPAEQFAAVGIATGAIVSQLGLVLAAPAIVGFASRLGRHLPATPRIALRDAARNRSRTAPAMAAVMAAVAGTSAIAVYVVSLNDADGRAYEPSARMGQALAYVRPGMASETREAVRHAVTSAMPVTGTHLVHLAYPGTCDQEDPCGEVTFLKAPEHRCTGRARDRRGGRCGQDEAYFDMAVVGDGGTVQALTGTSSQQVRRTLARGGVVVFDKKLVSDGTAYVRAVRYGGSGRDGKSTTTKVPAVHIPLELRDTGGVLSFTAARQLGLTVEPSRFLFGTSRMPTQDEAAEAEAALEERGLLLELEVERGYEGNLGLTLLALIAASAVVTLGASGIATGLALADGRADQTTLGAVGAGPSIRRTLAASQAGTVSWLGSGLGVLAGLVPGIAVVWAQRGLRIVLPWAGLALVLVVVPLLAMLTALLFTRSRLSLARRIE